MSMTLATAMVELGANTSGLKRDLGEAKSAVAGTVNQIMGLAATAGIGLAGAAAGFGIKFAAEAETMRTALNVVIKDMDRTKALLTELDQFSVVTPFTPQEVRAAGLSMVQLQVPLDEIQGRLQMIGDMAAGGGGNFSELVTIFNKIQMQGKLTGETMDQFVTQGVAILPALAEHLGKTSDEILKMREKGELTADMVTDLFKSMTGEGGVFYGAMIQQSTTFAGLTSTLQGVIGMMAQQLGDVLLPIAKEVVITLINMGNAIINLHNATGGASTVMVVLGTSIGLATIALKAFGAQLRATLMSLYALSGPLMVIMLMTAAFTGVALIVAKLVQWLASLPKIQAAWQQTTEALTAAWESLELAATAVWNAIMTALQPVFDMFGMMAPKVNNLKESFVDLVAAGIKGFGDWILWGAVWVETIAENMGLVSELVMVTFKLIGSYILDVLSNAWNVALMMMRVALGPWAETVFSVFQGIFDGIIAGVQMITTAFQVGLRTVIAMADTVLSVLGYSLSGVMDGITAAATAGAQQIAEVGGAINQGILQPTSEGTNQLKAEQERLAAELQAKFDANMADAQARMQAARSAQDEATTPEAGAPQPTAPAPGGGGGGADAGFFALDAFSRKMQEDILKASGEDKQQQMVDIGKSQQQIQMDIANSNRRIADNLDNAPAIAVAGT